MGKSLSIVVAVLFAAVITSAGCDNNQEKVLSVKDVQANQLHQGPITLIGIVMSVSSDNPKQFTLMDVDDARIGKTGRHILSACYVNKSCSKSWRSS